MEAPYSNSSKATDYESFFSYSHCIGLSVTKSLLFFLLYPTLVALFRYQRLRQTLEQYPYTSRRSFSSMTNEHAFYIQQILGELEFPFTYEKALQFALFRTYGIPSVSKLLVQTSEFSEKATATKRYVDTTVLVGEFAGYHPQSERSIEALGRMNFIHHQYRKCGKILDDDMLYTLSLFAGEPIRWIDKYEWRKLEDFEKCAMGTFWKAIGDAMGIEYEKLKSGGKDGEGWRDGLEWLEEVMEWGLEYEKKCMVPDENNRQTAEQTVAILLWGVPTAMKPYGRMAVSAIMDDRLRTAIMLVYRVIANNSEAIAILMAYHPDSRDRPKCISSSLLPSSQSANSSSATFSFPARPSYAFTGPQTSHLKKADTS